MKKLLLLVVMLICCGTSSLLLSIEIKPLRNITLSEEQGIIERGLSFVVTEDEKIFVVDMKASNIKIFDITGKRLSVFGSKGVGPDEFGFPTYITYNKPFFTIMDLGRSLIFTYKRSEKKNMEFYHKFLTLSRALEIKKLDNENLIIAGDIYDKKNRPHILYKYNLKTKKHEYILPSETPFGCSSPEEFKAANRTWIGYIGYLLFFDVSDDSIYLVWEGSNKVMRIDRKTYKITRFGEKSKNYVKAFYTKETEKAFRELNHKLLNKLKRPMSLVKKIFVTTGNNIGVAYAGPYKENGDLPVFVQFYTNDGKYLKEVKLVDAKASHTYEIHFYFSKPANRFYIMDTVTSEEFDQSYEVHEFQVEE